MRRPHNLLSLYDEIRSIAQTGLHYAQDKYDRERYARLLEIAVGEYAGVSGMSKDDVAERLERDIGPITPKVGAGAAIFDNEGRILLIKRHDTKCWAIPAGAGEVSENAHECAVRETLEETGLVCEARGVIDVFFTPAGVLGRPYAMWVPFIHCVVTGGQLQTTDEALEVGYFHPDEIPSDQYHADTEPRIRLAVSYWRRLNEQTSQEESDGNWT